MQIQKTYLAEQRRILDIVSNTASFAFESMKNSTKRTFVESIIILPYTVCVCVFRCALSFKEGQQTEMKVLDPKL